MAERPVRWAHLDELDNRCRVGSSAWHARHTQKQKLLSAWRALHAAYGTHRKVHNAAAPIKPSSNMNLVTMLARLRKIQGR